MPFRRFHAPRLTPGFAATVAFTLAAGVAVGLALFGFTDAGLAHVPAHILPGWNRAPGVHGWGEGVRTVEEIRHAGVQSLLRVLWGTTALVVASATVIAAARVLARGAARRNAVVMRVVLGAGARRILAFVMVDAGAAVLLGGVLGVAAGLGLGAMARASWPGAAWDGSYAGAALFGVALPVGVALLCALAPVALAYRRDLAAGLGVAERATAGRFEGWLRRVLTIAQFTASMALLVAAGTLLRGTLSGAADGGAGLDPRDTLTLSVALPARADDAARAAYLRDTLSRVRAIPGVRSAGVVSEHGWTGTGPRDAVTAFCEPRCVVAGLLVPLVPAKLHQIVASDGYFESLRVPVIEGRGFAPGAAWEAVVTRSAASILFPGAEPLGQHVMPRPEPDLLAAARPEQRYTVVGVVEDVRPLGPGVTEKVEPTMYLASPRHPPRVVQLAVRVAGDPMALAGAVTRAVRAAAPGAVIREVMTMEERMARFAAPVRWAAAVLTGLSVVGLLLACAGIFGVVREGVERRTREIGVRMALGAQPGQVVRHIVGDAMRITRTSLMLGTLAAFATARALQVYFHGIRPWDPALYLGVALLLSGVALAAAWLPARRAALVDPMVAIRAR